VLGVSRASLYRSLWASSALPGQLGNAFLYLAAGFLRADDLDAAARDEWIDFSISDEDVDAGLSPDEREFFAGHLRAGDRVLLVGCGAGRDLLALGRLGYHVDGLDHSPQVIAIARAHLARHGAAAALHTGTIESAALDRRYDAVIFSNGCYSLVRGARRRAAALARVADHLAPGGRVLISYHGFTRQSALGLWLLRTSARAARADWSPEPGDVFWRHRPGRALRYRHHFTREELNAEIEAAGFRPISDEHADGSLTWVAAVRP
jgi:SAM-dependent methyltransferase